MAKGAKVPKHTFSESSEDESDENLKPSYSKLAKIAVKQQRAIEKVQNMLDKSDDILGEEMDRTKALTENLQRLQTRFDNLQGHHNTLLSDHEKLSYEFLQRKQDLEKLRVSYEDLQKERDSLLAQQISAPQEEFVPPCLKCIERESANSSPECSNASNVTNSSPASAITNSSFEDIASITGDAGLKELYMTGMYKASKDIRLFVMCLKSRSSTGTLGKRVLPLRGNSMLMVHIGSLRSTPKPHGLLQRDLQSIHLIYLALHVNLLIPLMSHLTPTVNCSKIRMVKCLLDMLALTAGTVPL